jgi:hypothetical protein
VRSPPLLVAGHSHYHLHRTAAVKRGKRKIPGLLDTALPKHLGPKRASKTRRFFNLGQRGWHEKANG